MIKKIFIDNFKSLNDFTIELKPLTVIVGNNAMGKSSILQNDNLHNRITI